MRKLLPAILILTPLLLLSVDAPTTANWPQWRGPQSSGVATDKNLPVEWSATKNVAWKTSIPGRGHSSPIVWGNRIFLTSAIQGEAVPDRPKGKTHPYPKGGTFVHPDAQGYDHTQSFHVISIDAVSGKILWDKTVFDGPPADSAHSNGSFASVTPVTDGKMVYTHFGPDGVYAVDFQGKLAWKTDPGQFGSLSLGYSSSPVLFENLLIMQFDDDIGTNSAVLALDKTTGKEVWRVKRPTAITWASPALVRVKGRNELLTNANEFVISYDPATGKELWRSKGVGANAVATPLVKDDIAYFSTGYPKKNTLAIRVGSGDLTDTPNQLWSYDKGTAYVVSNIVYGDYIYLITDKGIVSCLDAVTGAVKYDNGRPPTPSRYTSSPVAYDGKIFVTSEDGDTFVVEAGPEHKILFTNSLDEPVFASPAIAGGSVYIRGTKNLYKIVKKSI